MPNPYLHYNGWNIYLISFKNKDHYKAEQYGVTINTNSLEGIKHMINQKNYDNRNFREKIGIYKQK